jgi:glycosyltransferase involved in cell wall biosynthesis
VRVGLDGRALQGRRTGVGRYVFEICRELDTLLPDAEFFVYAPGPVELPVSSGRWHCRLEKRRWALGLKPIAWLKLRAGALCRQDRLDVFWGCATLFPVLSAGVRRLTTVYDLTFRVAPDTMGTTHLVAQHLFFRRDVRRAHQRTAISHGTAARLQEWLGGPPAAVAPPGVSAAFRPAEPTTVARTLATLGITGPYFLAVATWEPRKNLELLIRVFRSMQSDGHLPDYRLVLAGGPGWKDERLRALLPGGSGSERARASETVMAFGFVSDEQLAQLYSGCRAFVFPSRYEGFGIPLLEARACGAAVVATDLPELREAGGDATIYVAPTPEGLRTGLLQVIARPAPAPLSPGRLPSWRGSASVLARYLHAD